MADLGKICDELAEAIEEADLGDEDEDFTAIAVWEQIQTPTVIIEPQNVDFTNAMKRGEQWNITLRLLLASVSEGASKEERFRFFGGAKDLKDALENHDGYNEIIDVFVRSAENFGTWQVSEIAYIGGEISVDVYA